MDVPFHEQVLFDQYLRDEHNCGLWEFLGKYGVEATNASHAIFFYSCGHLLDRRAEVSAVRDRQTHFQEDEGGPGGASGISRHIRSGIRFCRGWGSG